MVAGEAIPRGYGLQTVIWRSPRQVSLGSIYFIAPSDAGLQQSKHVRLYTKLVFLLFPILFIQFLQRADTFLTNISFFFSCIGQKGAG